MRKKNIEELKELLSSLTELEKAVLESICKSANYSTNAHKRKENTLARVKRNYWASASKVLKRFRAAGIIRKKRANTIQLTRLGRDLGKALASSKASSSKIAFLASVLGLLRETWRLPTQTFFQSKELQEN